MAGGSHLVKIQQDGLVMAIFFYVFYQILFLGVNVSWGIYQAQYLCAKNVTSSFLTQWNLV